MAASGSRLFLKMPKLMAIAHMRRASGPAGCGSATWLASASSFFLRSAASVALATAFSIANVMLGPLDVCAMFLAMKFSLLPEPVHVSVSAGWMPSLEMSVVQRIAFCMAGGLMERELTSLATHL